MQRPSICPGAYIHNLEKFCSFQIQQPKAARQLGMQELPDKITVNLTASLLVSFCHIGWFTLTEAWMNEWVSLNMKQQWQHACLQECRPDTLIEFFPSFWLVFARLKKAQMYIYTLYTHTHTDTDTQIYTHTPTPSLCTANASVADVGGGEGSQVQTHASALLLWPLAPPEHLQQHSFRLLLWTDLQHSWSHKRSHNWKEASPEKKPCWKESTPEKKLRLWIK